MSRSTTKRISHLAEYAGFRLLLAIFGTMSLERARRVGARLGRMAARILGGRLETAQKSIARHLADRVSPGQAREIALEVFANQGRMMGEMGHARRIIGCPVEAHFAFHEIENYRAAKALGKGVFFMFGHFSNWELAAGAHARAHCPITILVKTQGNPYVNRYIQRLRQTALLESLDAGESGRAMRILRRIRGGAELGMMMDQNTKDAEAVWVNFFADRAATQKSLALFALKTGIPVVPVWVRREADGRLHIYYEPMIEFEPTSDRERDIEALTREYMCRQEELIRRDPANWFWVHRRWKNRPPEEREC